MSLRTASKNCPFLENMKEISDAIKSVSYFLARLNDKEMQPRYSREGFRINTFSIIIDRLSTLKHFPKRGYCSSYVCVCGLPPVTVLENDRFLVYDELKIIYAQQ